MRVSIIGAGSWGTTLAALLAEKLDRVVVWSRRQEVAEEINTLRKNSAYLGDIGLPSNLYATSDIAEAVQAADHLVMAVPSRYFRSVCNLMLPYIDGRKSFLSVTKGIESESLKRMSEVLIEVFGIGLGQIAVLSGPNHAEEVIRKIPTASVVASVNAELAADFQNLLNTDYFRVYTHDDVIGVEVAGTVKNVLAIAVGIADGLGYGDNTRAALITRGLAEMLRLGKKMGAKPLTFLGLAGIGDLIATATSRHSRNRNFGEALGKREQAEKVLGSTRMVVEGVFNSVAVLRLAEKYGIEMPISTEVYRIIYEGKDPRESVSTLMNRAPKPEIDLV
jgi:glycerol-3-phosphate dehydrogenase (NAD(P)+)